MERDLVTAIHMTALYNTYEKWLRKSVTLRMEQHPIYARLIEVTIFYGYYVFTTYFSGSSIGAIDRYIL